MLDVYKKAMKLRLIKIFFYLIETLFTFEIEIFQIKCLILAYYEHNQNNSKIMLFQILHSLSRPNIINGIVFILEIEESVFL